MYNNKVWFYVYMTKTYFYYLAKKQKPDKYITHKKEEEKEKHKNYIMLQYPTSSPVFQENTKSSLLQQQQQDENMSGNSPTKPSAKKSASPSKKKMRKSAPRDVQGLLASVELLKQELRMQDEQRRMVEVVPPMKELHVLVLGVPHCGAACFAANYSGERVDEDTHESRSVQQLENDFVAVRTLCEKNVFNVKQPILRGAEGAIIVCDAQRPASVRTAAKWKRELDTACEVLGLSPLRCVLVVNKSDGAAQRGGGGKLLSRSQVTNIVQEESEKFEEIFLASALTGNNVKEAFEAILLKKQSKVEKESPPTIVEEVILKQDVNNNNNTIEIPSNHLPQPVPVVSSSSHGRAKCVIS